MTQAHRTHFEVGTKVRKTIEELGGTMPEEENKNEDKC
jgi:DNA-damage-inducible protein D